MDKKQIRQFIKKEIKEARYKFDPKKQTLVQGVRVGKAAEELVGMVAREKVFKRNKIDKFDYESSNAIILKAIDILEELL